MQSSLLFKLNPLRISVNCIIMMGGRFMNYRYLRLYSECLYRFALWVLLEKSCYAIVWQLGRAGRFINVSGINIYNFRKMKIWFIIKT